MVVTEIRKIGKGNRYYLYVDDNLFGIIEAEILARHHMKQGLDIGEKELEKIKIENGDYACFNRGLAVLAKSMKSEKMLRDFLKGKGYPLQCIDRAIDKLKEYGYIDDESFCENYIATYSSSKSKRKIKYELLSKGVDEQIIEEKLATFEDEEEEAVCRRLAEKYLRNKEFDLKTKQKYFNSMLGKGFDYTLILKMWEEITNDRD